MDRLAAGSIDVENVKDVLYDMLKNAGDEEIDTIAQEKIKQWDTNGDGKVTLSDFTEYVIKSIAAEKDPWEFAQE
jgi:Ca2+-binding EF-hand superfamily protein